MGRFLVILGAALVVAGLLLMSGIKVPYVGRLPGDIYMKRGDFTFYFPLATSVIISIVLTLILYLLRR